MYEGWDVQVQSSRVTTYSQGGRKKVRCNGSTLYPDREFFITWNWDLGEKVRYNGGYVVNRVRCNGTLLYMYVFILQVQEAGRTVADDVCHAAVTSHHPRSLSETHARQQYRVFHPLSKTNPENILRPRYGESITESEQKHF